MGQQVHHKFNMSRIYKLNNDITRLVFKVWDSLHALLEERQSSCLTDDQISPLHNHNRDEESCVAGVLQLLTLGVGL